MDGGSALAHLELDRLSRSYAGRPAVQDLSLTLARGAFVALLGPSGCGKTTTLRMVAGLEAPDAGRVLVGGRDVTREPPHRRRMGVVFQSYALFPHMTAEANVGFGLEMSGLRGRARGVRVAAALALVGLSEHGAKRPRELSGGQQQRVALARALAIEPDVLLLDEPLSALDAKLREELRAEMRLIQRRVGATALFVTHDQAEALAIADVVAVMDRGRIVQAGPPEEVFERPATAFVASFVGRSAQLPGTARGGAVQAGPALLRSTGTPAAPPPDGEVTVFVRPHRIRLLLPAEGADNVLDGVVTSVDYTGEVAHLLVRTPAGPVPVDVGTASGAWRGVAPGQAVRLGWRAADTLCFRRGEA